MKQVFERLKFLKDPHSEKIDQYKARYLELNELSQIAVGIQDEAAYKSLQEEMREVFFDYLTATTVDSIYKLLPHLLLICLISLKVKTVIIPIVNWQVNVFFAYLSIYLLVNIARPVIKAVKSRLKKFGVVDLQS